MFASACSDIYLLFTCCSFQVAFGWSRFRSNITTGVGDMVRVFVNGKELPTKMQLLERGRCVFVTGAFVRFVAQVACCVSCD